jgi:hypothetical protein
MITIQEDNSCFPREMDFLLFKELHDSLINQNEELIKL